MRHAEQPISDLYRRSPLGNTEPKWLRAAFLSCARCWLPTGCLVVPILAFAFARCSLLLLGCDHQHQPHARSPRGSESDSPRTNSRTRAEEKTPAHIPSIRCHCNVSPLSLAPRRLFYRSLPLSCFALFVLFPLHGRASPVWGAVPSQPARRVQRSLLCPSTVLPSYGK